MILKEKLRFQQRIPNKKFQIILFFYEFHDPLIMPFNNLIEDHYHF